MQIDQNYSSEQFLDSEEFKEFTRSIKQAHLHTQDGIKLSYAYINHPNSDKLIVFSSGRVESHLKYQQFFYDCFQQGYSIYAMDHRGQGLSQRLTTNPQQGYVEKFNDYIDDLNLFIEQIIKPLDKIMALVCHSMGSAIGAHYIKQYPATFTKVVFCAPMFGIKLPVNKHIIYWLARYLDSNKSGRQPNYVLGGKDYHRVPFDNNDLTHSEVRFSYNQQLIEQNPQLKLGSPTNHWLTESISAADKAIKYVNTSKFPILILQAEQDIVVDNKAHFKALGTGTTLYQVAGARHEILMELDPIRNDALNQIFNFL